MSDPLNTLAPAGTDRDLELLFQSARVSPILRDAVERVRGRVHDLTQAQGWEAWAERARGHREANEWDAARLAADVADHMRYYELHVAALATCGVCKGAGVVDENGNPYVHGRSDSYECAVCGETE